MSEDEPLSADEVQALSHDEKATDARPVQSQAPADSQATRAQPVRPSTTTPASRSSRTTSSRGSDVSKTTLHLDPDELDTVLAYVRLPPSRVTQHMLAGLTDSGVQFYHQLRNDAAREPAAGASVPLPNASPRRVAFSPSVGSLPGLTSALEAAILQPPPMSSPASRRPPPVTARNFSLPAVTRSLSTSFDSVAGGERATEFDAEPGLHEPTVETPSADFAPTSSLLHVLQRQGVPTGPLCAMDALQLARDEVGDVSFEQWWLARSSQIKGVSSAVYYEGLLLSLLLDYMDQPHVWQQLAARRWYILNLVSNRNMQWSQARGLLPLTAVGSMSTNVLYELQRYEKSQKDLYPSSSTRGKADGKGASGGNSKAGQRGKGGSNNTATSGEGAVSAANASRAPSSRRSNEGGAGAASAASASGQ